MKSEYTPITRVEVIGLHGTHSIIADFSSSIKILVDKNGSGKTTLLYLLANLLKGDVVKLSKYNFEEIRINFNGSSFSLTNKEISLVSGKANILNHLSNMVPEDIVYHILEDVDKPYSVWRNKNPLIENISELLEISPRRLYDTLRSEFSLNSTERNLSDRRLQQSMLLDSDEKDNILQKMNSIKEAFPYEILYFPTYRLVEENVYGISNLKEPSRRKQGDLEIQFGMQSVDNRFKRITDDIRQSSVEWYSRINGQMLSQLINGLPKDSIEYNNIKRPETLRIVLDRIGEYISESDKSTILQLVTSGRIEEFDFTALAYFISNLVKVYEQQQVNDNAIKAFVKVVNGYLDDKQIIYDESKLIIYPRNKITERRMNLDTLSSGEKQIISLFSRLYLDKPKPYAIFFDEPELSLSLEWQRKLLQDIADSDKCEFLLAATHSPFIFENDLVKYADVLKLEYLDNNNIYLQEDEHE